LLVMGTLRRVLRLEQYLTFHHFNNLSKLLLLMSLLWLYFTFAEHQTVWYGNEPGEMAVFAQRVRGPYAPLFWTMVTCNFIVPFVLMGIRRLRTIASAMAASLCVLVGMWLERYLIVVPTLANPRLPAAAGIYWPTWIEITITAATFAAMILLYLLFSKLFPIIAVWEFKPHPVEED
jgi:Ni/Fe-hydrogenase subunit HybB-like protein